MSPIRFPHHTSKLPFCFRKVEDENKLNMMEGTSVVYWEVWTKLDPINESGIWRKAVRATQKRPSHATQGGQGQSAELSALDDRVLTQALVSSSTLLPILSIKKSAINSNEKKLTESIKTSDKLLILSEP